jgi:hypothetical protein
MISKIAIAAALIAGTASVAFAEGDSTIGIYGPNGQAAQPRSVPAFTGRNVGLTNGRYIVRDAQGGYDRASSP